MMYKPDAELSFDEHIFFVSKRKQDAISQYGCEV